MVLSEEADIPEPEREAETVPEAEPAEPMIPDDMVIAETDAPEEVPDMDSVVRDCRNPETTVEAAIPIANPEPELAALEASD